MLIVISIIFMVQVQVKKTEMNFAELSGDKLTVQQELLVPRGAGNVQGDHIDVAVGVYVDVDDKVVQGRQ